MTTSQKEIFIENQEYDWVLSDEDMKKLLKNGEIFLQWLEGQTGLTESWIGELSQELFKPHRYFTGKTIKDLEDFLFENGASEEMWLGLRLAIQKFVHIRI